jgi:hypothetical protein
MPNLQNTVAVNLPAIRRSPFPSLCKTAAFGRQASVVGPRRSEAQLSMPAAWSKRPCKERINCIEALRDRQPVNLSSRSSGALPWFPASTALVCLCFHPTVRCEPEALIKKGMSIMRSSSPRKC